MKIAEVVEEEEEPSDLRSHRRRIRAIIAQIYARIEVLDSGGKASRVTEQARLV